MLFVGLPLEIERIKPQIEAKISELGAELVELSYFRMTGRSILRVIVDKDGGVTLEDCSNINRQLGEYFDSLEEGFSGAYLLEVNSPGLDRPLKSDRDFTKAQGESLRITYQDEQGKTMTVTGMLNAYSDGTLAMTLTPKGTELSVPVSRVLKAVRDIRI